MTPGQDVQMKRLDVSVLFYESRDGKSAEHDQVVDQVSQALAEGGHKAMPLGINSDLRELLDRLEEQKPDIVFNLCETFADRDVNEVRLAAVLEMLGVRFTGTGSTGMALRMDKVLTKKLLKFHDIPCPSYAVLGKNRLESDGKLSLPLFVKPLRGDGSLCIDDFSLVNSYDELIERVDIIHERLRDDALAEEFVEGREFCVSTLGNSPPEALPLIELDFSALPRGSAHIYGWQAKFDAASAEYKGTISMAASDLSPEARSRISRVAVEAVRALHLNDYGRVDIRLSTEGIPFVIEVNANPYLEKTDETSQAALKAGMGYGTFVNRILETAWKRWEQEAPGMVRRPTRASIRRRTAGVPDSCLRAAGTGLSGMGQPRE